MLFLYEFYGFPVLLFEWRYVILEGKHKITIVMKKQQFKNLQLKKSFVSNLTTELIKGGTNWPPRENESQSCFGDCETYTGQTGSWCLTGNQTNCQ